MREFFSFTLILFCLIPFSLRAEYMSNPFMSFNHHIKFLKKQLDEAEEKQKPGIKKRLADAEKQKAQAVAKRKQPYLRKIKDLEKYLSMAKSDSKKASLKLRIKREKNELNRINAFSAGANKFDIDKEEIETLKYEQEKDAESKKAKKSKKPKQQGKKSKTVVD